MIEYYPPETEKICSVCRVSKTLDNYTKHDPSPFGKSARCKACSSIVRKIQRDSVPMDQRGVKNKIEITGPKECTCCKVAKELTGFSKSRLTADNYNYWCKECTKVGKAKSKAKKPEMYRLNAIAYSKMYREQFPEKVTESYKTWSRSNPDCLNAIRAVRRSMKINATPSWMDKEEIKKVYTEASERVDEHGEKFHVDHLVPLVSDFVCGLHCTANLMAIPAKENLRKSNSWWPDMWPITEELRKMAKEFYENEEKEIDE